MSFMCMNGDRSSIFRVDKSQMAARSSRSTGLSGSSFATRIKAHRRVRHYGVCSITTRRGHATIGADLVKKHFPRALAPYTSSFSEHDPRNTRVVPFRVVRHYFCNFSASHPAPSPRVLTRAVVVHTMFRPWQHAHANDLFRLRRNYQNLATLTIYQKFHCRSCNRPLFCCDSRVNSNLIQRGVSRRHDETANKTRLIQHHIIIIIIYKHETCTCVLYIKLHTKCIRCANSVLLNIIRLSDGYV